VPLGDLHDVPARRALAAAGVRLLLRRSATEVQVSRVAAARPAVSGVVVHGPRESSEVLPADAVIVAVPHDVAARLLPPGAVDDPARLAGLGAAPIVNVHVRYDRRVLGAPFAAALGTPVQWIFDRSAAAGIRDGQYLALSLSAADGYVRASATQLREMFLPALAQLLPAAGAARVLDFFVTREPRATFRQVPGSGAARPPARSAIDGLWLAGAYTATGWPATMEGAVRSGLTAARGALEGATRTDVTGTGTAA
jgi:uncharacterized protein with NAD-binding domain and iron-sulfur cluster